MQDVHQAPWAGNGESRLDALKQVQRGLTVDKIMTPRARLMTCRREESAREVMARNTDRYSFFPVVDGEERILGLYQAERWFAEEAPDQPIDNEFEVLSEALVIGADATIVDFVKSADERPARLVVSGHQVAGLIGLSDLQQLPVRAALFTLITSLEMAMTKRIKAEWPDSADCWLQSLSKRRRDRTLSAIEKTKRDDGFVSEILHTQLHDKATIICKRRLMPGSRRNLERCFKKIGDLRDQVAHANNYAETPDKARDVCSVVRTILEFQTSLHDAIAQTNEAPSTKT